MDAESLSYRSPMNIGPAQIVPDSDSDNFSTLEDVYKKLKKELQLLEHVNSFDVLKAEEEEKASAVLLRQIYAKQMAYQILEPIVMQLKSAVQDIKQAEKGE